MNDLLKKLNSKNITIHLKDDQLDIKAPKGVMNAELLSEIKEHKEALISFISKYNASKETTTVIPVASGKSNYVLSSSQYRLWILQQLESDNSAYNMPCLLALKGVIHIPDLERAFLKLVERHEILRTNIRIEKETGIPKQYISTVDSNNFKLHYLDISDNADISKTIQLIKEKEVGYQFNLESESLIRVSLIKKSTDDYVFISVMHHIISDGWSSDVLVSDLFSFYQSITKEENKLPAPLSVQYKDFAEWQQIYLKGNELEVDKNYWLNQFKNEVPLLDIPTYKLRPSVKTYYGKTIKKHVDKETLQAFKKLCKDQGATLFMGLLSTVKVLLYKYTNQPDIVIGSPFAGRQFSVLQNQIGFYVNTVGLRTPFKKEDTFETLLHLVKKTTLEAYAHENYPFDELIKELEIQTDRSRNPLFDVVLTVDFQESLSDKFNLSTGILIEEIAHTDTTSKFDLEFSFKEDKQGCNLFLTYNTDLYTEEFIVQASDHLEVILKNIIKSPAINIDSISYLTEEETKRIKNFNATEIDYKLADKTYVDLFEESVNKKPDHTAVVFENKRITYKGLDELSNQFAHYLINNYSVGIDDFIGVKLERSDWLIVSFLAVLKTGAAYLPIDLEYPEERISFIESDSKCKVVVDDSIISDFEKSKDQLKTRPKIRASHTDLAYLIYTSGSTGLPKGTLIQHKGLLNLCFWHINQYKVTHTSKATLYSGISFDASIWEIAPYLLSAAALFPINKENIRLNMEELCLFLNDQKITHSYLPTVICHELINKNKELHYTHVLTGGDALKIKKAPHFKLYNNYGPTENTIVTTSFFINELNDYSSIPIGKPVSNTRVYILDDQLNPLPIGIPGRLYISGDSLAKGYLNLRELTEEKFIDNPFEKGERMYDSGDTGKWLPDGNIVFLGRKDHQIKLRGFRIELGEIENTILKFSQEIHQTVVYLKERDEDKVLVAFFSSEKTIDKKALKYYLQQNLPIYMVPDYFIELDAIPQTKNGKIDQASLLAMPLPEKKSTDYVGPNTETEAHLIEIWQKVLDVSKIGIYDNFFELGGSSLKITRMLYDINEFFDIQLQTKEVLSAINIHELAKVVDKEQIFRSGISPFSSTNNDNNKHNDVWEI